MSMPNGRADESSSGEAGVSSAPKYMLIAAPASVIGAEVPFSTCTVTRIAGPATLPGPFAVPWTPSIEVRLATTPLPTAAGESSGTSAAGVGSASTSDVGPVGDGVGGFGMTLVSRALLVEAEVAAFDVPLSRLRTSTSATTAAT